MLDDPILTAPLAAFLIGLCAVPMVRCMAIACGFVDNPDQWRKRQSAPIALGGGIAVWFAVWSGWCVSVFGSTFPSQLRGIGEVGWFLAALALATLLVLGLGIIDDRSGMRARHKLAGQVLAAVILMSGGLHIDALSCFGVELKLGVFGYPTTIFWILLVVNAFNLIDGMDGLCASLGLVAALAIAVLAYRSGRAEDATVALALAGALVAFLVFNLPPAKIYFGDAGSMTVGLFVAALSVRCCTNERRTAVVLLPVLALLTLPLLDTVTAVCRRWLKGRSIFAPDLEHLHHCLRSRLGGSPVAALGAAFLLATVGAGGAVLAMSSGMGEPTACLAIAIGVGLLLGTKTFGATESRLLFFRARVAVTPFLSGLAVQHQGTVHKCHLHGSRDWAGLWNAVVLEGEASGVWRIELAIDIEAAGEVYCGHWSLPSAAAIKPHWSVTHTLYAGDVAAGTISVCGKVDACGSPYLHKVEKLVRVVECRLVADQPVVSSASESASLSKVNLPVNSALT